jgi:phage tail-like protein
MYSTARTLLRRLSVAKFSVNAGRLDPYKGFKFRVKWDGQYIAGVSRVSGLNRSTEVTTIREGADPSSSIKMPGRTEYDAITLSRGVTHDPAFEQWANKVWQVKSQVGGEASLADFRKDITIELLNEAGQLVLAYNVFRCWPSNYSALVELDANTSVLAIESITLQNEGWERDVAVTEPTEPRLD